MNSCGIETSSRATSPGLIITHWLFRGCITCIAFI